VGVPFDSGAEIDANNDIGWMPLNWTSEKSSLEMARLLIEDNANTDGIDLTCIGDYR